MRYEWDEDKNAVNIAERGFSFAFASKVFENKGRATTRDRRKDYGELRFITLGRINDRLYVVVHTPRGEEVTRIISARKANKREQRAFYAQENNEE